MFAIRSGRNTLGRLLVVLSLGAAAWMALVYLPLRREREAIRAFVEMGRQAVLRGDAPATTSLVADPVSLGEESHEPIRLARADLEKRVERLFRNIKFIEIEVRSERIDVVTGSLRATVRLEVRTMMHEKSLDVQVPKAVKVTMGLARTQPEAPWAIVSIKVKTVRGVGGGEEEEAR
jgi:hypothetical protein